MKLKGSLGLAAAAATTQESVQSVHQYPTSASSSSNSPCSRLSYARNRYRATKEATNSITSPLGGRSFPVFGQPLAGTGFKLRKHNANE